MNDFQSKKQELNTKKEILLKSYKQFLHELIQFNDEMVAFLHATENTQYEIDAMLYATTELDKIARITAGLSYAENPTNPEVIADLEENISFQKEKNMEALKTSNKRNN